MSLLAMNNLTLRNFITKNVWLALVCMIGGLILACSLFCVHSLARKVPTNYYLMLAFTFCEAYIVSFVCAVITDKQVVVAAAFMTAALVVAITIYAMTTSEDFTYWGGLVSAMTGCFMMFGIFCFWMGP